MGYFEANMKALEKERPELYKEIKKVIDKDGFSLEHIETAQARDGSDIISIVKDGKSYRLNSAYRPLQEAEKWTDQYRFQNLNTTVLMFGMGNSIFVHELLKKMQSDAKLYLYEPDISVFIYNLYNVDIVDIIKDGKIYFFITGINENEFSDVISSEFHWSMIPTQIICNHPVYDKLYMESYKEFLLVIKKMNNMQAVDRDTEQYLARSTIRNALLNMKYIKKSNYVPEFEGKIPEDVPIIIVSAGPSLDKNIDQLKRAEGKAFIFATDTAVKYLLAHEIHFDAMITIDANKYIGHLSDERCKDIPLFCVLEAKNEIMEMHTGRKVWFRGSVVMYALYEKFGRTFPDYNPGGSVATAAFSVAVALNTRRIVMIGQDLAYSGDATHAGGVVKAITGEEYGQEMVESIDGGKVRTRYDWLIYKDWFEESIKDLKDIDVIDATEGGALIKGTKIMTLSEVIDKYCNHEFSVRALIENMPYTFSDKEYAEVKKTLEHLSKGMANIKQKATEGKKACKKLLFIINAGNRNEEKEQKYLKQIGKINNFIEKQDAYELMNVYITAAVTEKIQSINCMSDDATQNMLDTINISESVYDALLTGVEELSDVVEKGISEL